MNGRVLSAGSPLAAARVAVILIHGRGSSADDILGLAEAMPAQGIAFLAPEASEGTWYPRRFLAPLKDNEPELSRALLRIGDLVGQAAAAGVPANRVGLAGFSQGGCLALEYAARHPKRYGFVAGLSGALIGPLDTPRPAGDLARTPVLIACAEADGHIPLAHVKHSAGVMSRLNAELTARIFPGAAHSVFPEEIEWLQDQAGRLAAQAM